MAAKPVPAPVAPDPPILHSPQLGLGSNRTFNLAKSRYRKIRRRTSGRFAKKAANGGVPQPTLLSHGCGRVSRESNKILDIPYTTRTWRDVMGRIEGKGKRGSRTKRRGAKRRDTPPGQRRESDLDRQNGIVAGTRRRRRLRSGTPSRWPYKRP